MWLFLLLLALPLAEIALMIIVGGWIGLWPTLGLLFAGSLLGFLLIRSAGVFTIAELETAAREARDPAEPLMRGAFMFVAAVLFIIPGFLTDLAAAFLLLPFVQQLVLKTLLVGLREGADTRRGTGARQSGVIVDVEYHEVVDPGERTMPRDGSRGSGWTGH